MKPPRHLSAGEVADLLQILGLEIGASEQTVKTQYRELAKKHHPDRNHGSVSLKKKGEEQLKKINVAYERVMAHFAATHEVIDNLFNRKAAENHERQEREAQRSRQNEERRRREEESKRREAERLRRREERKREAERLAARRAIRERKKRVVAKVQAMAALRIAEAQYMLGQMFESGHLVNRHVGNAIGWYRLAAEQGHAGAQIRMGYNSERVGDWEEAAMWYRLALAQSDDGIQSSEEPTSVTPEMNAAFRELVARLSSLAERGNQEFQTLHRQVLSLKPDTAEFYHFIGQVFGSGRVVSKNEAMEGKYYRLAVALGYAEAQADLAFLYEWGNGVQRDELEAIRLYELAVLQGVERAEEPLRLLRDYCETKLGVDLLSLSVFHDVRKLRRSLALRGFATRWRNKPMDPDSFGSC